MSGTRSLSKTAPATDAAAALPLVIVAHGDRGGERGNRLAHLVAERAGCLPGFRSVHTCFVRGEPTIRSVAGELPPGRAVVYPLFMSDGYYVQQAIPQQMAAGGSAAEETRIMRPFGLSPLLPGIIADLAREAAARAAIEPEDATLLLVAHGSRKSPNSRNATLGVARRLAERSLFGTVETAFLEEPPFLADQLAGIDRPLIIVGLFAGEGLHGAEDLPHAVAASGRTDVALAEPLSRSAALVELICGELSASC
jgi:sirohydrochlorin ferrochelatase